MRNDPDRKDPGEPFRHEQQWNRCEGIVRWDPFGPEMADPVRALDRVRVRAPLVWTDRGGGFWALTRYEDIARVARDFRRFGQGRPQRGAPRPPLEVDPPLHTAYRAILRPYFTGQRLASFEDEVRSLVVARLQPLLDQGGGDVAPTLTHPLPTEVLCRFLRLPSQSAQIIDRLSDEIYRNEEGRGGNPEAVAAADAELTEHAFSVVSARRRAPEDPEVDLISGLIAARIDGAALDDAQIVEVLRLLFVAGHNSTTSSLGICLLALARDREAQETLRGRPAMLPRAIDEFLRLETPVLGMPRTVREETDLFGARLAPGDQLFLLWGSANRDDRVFEEAATCRLDRQPNKHMVFGRGIHSCLGRELAEMELRVVCEELLARTSSIELAGEVTRTSWVRFGVSRLPLRLFAR